MLIDTNNKNSIEKSSNKGFIMIIIIMTIIITIIIFKYNNYLKQNQKQYIEASDGCVYINIPKQVNKGLFLALFVIAILSSFHAAMRTYLSPCFFILASMLVLPDSDKKTISKMNV